MYYPWSYQALKIAKNVLSWHDLFENSSTRRIILDSKNTESFEYYIEKYKNLIGKLTSSSTINQSNGYKLFILKEYTGNLNQYFKFVRDIELYIKKNIPKISTITWLHSYVTPFDIMNKEKLEFEIIDYDFVLMGESDIGHKNKISRAIYEYALKNQIKIYYDIPAIEDEIGI